MNSARSLAAICIASIMVPVIPFLLIGELPGEAWLRASSEHSLVFGLTGALLLVSDIVLPIPSSILGTLLGARLGAVAGVASTFVGLMLGNLLGYGLGRLGRGHTQAQVPTAPAVSRALRDKSPPPSSMSTAAFAPVASTHAITLR